MPNDLADAVYKMMDASRAMYAPYIDIAEAYLKAVEEVKTLLKAPEFEPGPLWLGSNSKGITHDDNTGLSVQVATGTSREDVIGVMGVMGITGKAYVVEASWVDPAKMCSVSTVSRFGGSERGQTVYGQRR